MAQKFNYDRAATVLVDAALLGDRTAAQKWKITARSISNYRSRLEVDPELSRFFQLKKSESDRGWASEIPAMLQAAIEFLKRAAQEADPKCPEAIHAIAGSVKILAEVQAMRDVIDARISGQSKGQIE